MTEELTTTEAAHYLGISSTMIIKLIRKGRLRYRIERERRGKIYLITRKALEDYKEQWEADKKAKELNQKTGRIKTERNGRWG